MNKWFKIFVILMFGRVAYADSTYFIMIESSTSATLAKLNSAAAKKHMANKPIGDIVEWTALQLVGQPYKARLLDQKIPEYLYVTLGDTDCMIFVEEVLAASWLIKSHSLNIGNLIDQTRNLRYHGNVTYCNRNHYFKDWASANIIKGYVVDEGYKLAAIPYPYPADVMSAALSESSNMHAADLSCISEREKLINSQEQIGYLPLKVLPRYLKSIKSGDIIGIVRSPNGHADAVHHLGIAYVHGHHVSMIHASSKAGDVVVADSLTGYLGQFPDSQGIILMRPSVTNSK